MVLSVEYISVIDGRIVVGIDVGKFVNFRSHVHFKHLVILVEKWKVQTSGRVVCVPFFYSKFVFGRVRLRYGGGFGRGIGRAGGGGGRGEHGGISLFDVGRSSRGVEWQVHSLKEGLQSR